MNGCELKIDITLIDNFSGTVDKSQARESQDSYTYSVSLNLNHDVTNALALVQARPAPLGPHTNTTCTNSPSCAFTWLRIQTPRPVLKQTTTLNGFLNFSGHVDHFLIPMSSTEVGNQLIAQLRTIADARCQ